MDKITTQEIGEKKQYIKLQMVKFLIVKRML